MVTIIITAYNVSETIGRAIESCLSQTFNDIEILIIDDSSTDDTVDVIKGYDDNRIRLVRNETNLGAGLSRRKGTKLAKGEYTLFLDGDDWLDNDMIETLHNEAVNNNADIVSSGMRIIDENYKEINHSTYEKHEIMSGKDGLLTNSVIKRWLNNKLVKRSLWDIVEYSGRRFVEDTQTCFYLMHYANVLVNIPYIGYNYYQNSKSLCHNTSNLKRQIYSTLAAKDMCMFLKEKGELEFIKALRGFTYHLFSISDIVSDDKISNYSDEWNEIMSFLYENINWCFPPVELLVSEKFKFVYCLISKNGCSSIMSSILKNDYGITPKDTKVWKQNIKEFKKIKKEIINMYDFDPKIYEGYTVFTVLRDNLDRFVSYVNNTYKEEEYRKIFDKNKNAKEYVDDVIKKYPEQKLVDRHAVPQDVYISIFDIMFKGNIYAVDINDLSEFYKKLTGQEMFINNVTKENEKICNRKNLSKEQIRSIEKMLK